MSSSREHAPEVTIPFEIGALYHRRDEIHARFEGQRQGGISTPRNQPVVIAFTGEAGKSHGYEDFWDSEGVFHYYGEGQSGDMTFTGGNRAIAEHQADGNKLLVFQMMGKSKPYRYLGEFTCLGSYLKGETPATRGPLRTAIVFRLLPLADKPFGTAIAEPTKIELALGATVKQRVVEVRQKQALFRRRLLCVEKGCRLTGVEDLRFLRASHIKPWAQCETGDERTDGHNGFLLTPQADLLFDRGWISFENKGTLIVASALPEEIRRRSGLNLTLGRRCGDFTTKQQSYLEFHRSQIFEKRFSSTVDPLEDLVSDLSNS